MRSAEASGKALAAAVSVSIQAGALLSLASQCLTQLALKLSALAAATAAPPNASPATKTKQAELTTAENLEHFLAKVYPQSPNGNCEQFLTESKAFSGKVGDSKAKKN